MGIAKTSFRKGTQVAITALFFAASTMGCGPGTPASPTLTPPVIPVSTTPYIFGVLIAQQQYLSTDYAAGVRLAQISVNWSQYEPTQGTYSATYRNQMIATFAAYRNAGFKLALVFGTNSVPAWVTNTTTCPNCQNTSQFSGNGTATPIYSGYPNFEFNEALRLDGAAFIADVLNTIGHVDYIRAGLSNTTEVGYPKSPNGEWWAGDAIANGDTTGLPPTVTVSPYPHWYPGMLYQGKPATATVLNTWWNWYFNSMVDAHLWEAAAIRSAGFTGPIMFGMPGTGQFPNEVAYDLTPCAVQSGTQCTSATEQGLTWNPSDPYHDMNAGAAYHLFMDALKNQSITPSTNFMIDITSVYDNSGTPRGNACQASDSSVAYLTDQSVNSWSSVRWLAFNATRDGFSLIGENPGENSASDMTNVVSLMESCKLSGLMWAFDNELYNNVDATIANYKAAILAANP